MPSDLDLFLSLPVAAKDVGLLFLFGAFQLGVGFILFTTGARLIPAGETILLSLLESILAPIWVWIWPTMHEYPGDRAVIGGGLVIAAVIWNTVADMGQAKREKFEFDMTCIFPRELHLLLERNGLKVAHLWGNYDGSKLTSDSPRMIACCSLR